MADEAGRLVNRPVRHHDTLELLEDLSTLLDKVCHNGAGDAV